ncbi:MAG: MFS transporter [Oscillospiraceae bacterium]|nr:MFS transporter [Oscillospiraceae bacterium]
MKKKGYYPYLILILCFLIQGGILGIISNCRGLFYTPVCQELGIELGVFTAYATFYGVALCAAIPLATKMVRRGNLRMILTGAGLTIAAMEYAMAWFTAPWQWYIAAAVQGACHAILFVQTIPMLIDNWFAARKGFFLGLACSASGVVGAVMNQITQRYMAVHGWRDSYRMLGLALFLLIVPACAAFSVRKPEDIGAKPYGADRPQLAAKKTEGTFREFASKKEVFALLIGYAGLMCLTVGYNQIIFSLGLTFDHAPEQASTFVSLAMIGTIVWKLTVGWMNDRFGTASACYFSGGITMIGLVLLIMGRAAVPMMAGSFLMGMPMAASIVVMPNLVRGVFGNREFERRYKPLSIVANLASNFSFTLIGWLVTLGSYQTALAAGILVTGGALVLVVAAFGIRKRSFLYE